MTEHKDSMYFKAVASFVPLADIKPESAALEIHLVGDEAAFRKDHSHLSLMLISEGYLAEQKRYIRRCKGCPMGRIEGVFRGQGCTGFSIEDNKILPAKLFSSGYTPLSAQKTLMHFSECRCKPVLDESF